MRVKTNLAEKQLKKNEEKIRCQMCNNIEFLNLKLCLFCYVKRKPN